MSASAGRVLWLTKRRYMNKDLLDDRYGRYFELPRRLAHHNMAVTQLAISYRGEPAAEVEMEAGYRVISLDITRPFALRRAIAAHTVPGQFDIVIGSADIPYCLLAGYIGKRVAIPYVCDLYENFEAYASGKLPGMLAAYDRALEHAALNVAFEPLLAEHLRNRVRARAGAERWRDNFAVIPNAIDDQLFYPRERAACRAALGIAPDRPVFGYFGAVALNRGIEVIFRAWSQLRKRYPDALLLMAGAKDAKIALPSEGVRYLGALPHAQIPALIGASDLCLISYSVNGFGRFSFPAKAFEYLACHRPILAPAIGGIVPYLADFPEYLYSLGDAQELAEKMIALWAQDRYRWPPVMSLDQAGARYAELLRGVMTPTAHPITTAKTGEAK